MKGRISIFIHARQVCTVGEECVDKGCAVLDRVMKCSSTIIVLSMHEGLFAIVKEKKVENLLSVLRGSSFARFGRMDCHIVYAAEGM